MRKNKSGWNKKAKKRRQTPREGKSKMWRPDLDYLNAESDSPQLATECKSYEWRLNSDDLITVA